jgi:hypothetical protein
MKPLVSLHIIHYSCPNCGEEVEEVKMCKGCNAPMRVIKTVELYGDEANEYLDNLQETNKKETVEKKTRSVEFDDSVIGSESDELAINEDEESSSLELGEIFPEQEDDDENSERKYVVGDLGADFEEALGFLDQEDDEISDDMKDLPEL